MIITWMKEFFEIRSQAAYWRMLVTVVPLYLNAHMVQVWIFRGQTTLRDDSESTGRR